MLLPVAIGMALALVPPGEEGSITGDYIEDRMNQVHGCYCEWSGESVTAGREAVLAWRIASGGHGGERLDGLAFVFVLRADSSMSTGNPHRKSAMFIDRRATAAQRKAVERLAREQFGALIGTVVANYSSEIQFARDCDSAQVRIPGVLNVKMRRAVLPEDALPGATKWFDPFIPLEEAVLGTVLDVEYAGKDFDSRWRKSENTTSGYFGSFRLPVRKAAAPLVP
jgi:hypothetical protein